MCEYYSDSTSLLQAPKIQLKLLIAIYQHMEFIYLKFSSHGSTDKQSCFSKLSKQSHQLQINHHTWKITSSLRVWPFDQVPTNPG